MLDTNAKLAIDSIVARIKALLPDEPEWEAPPASADTITKARTESVSRLGISLSDEFIYLCSVSDELSYDSARFYTCRPDNNGIPEIISANLHFIESVQLNPDDRLYFYGHSDMQRLVFSASRNRYLIVDDVDWYNHHTEHETLAEAINHFMILTS